MSTEELARRTDMIPSDQDREAAFAERRLRMVETQIIRRGVRDDAVLDAMRTVPRHLFIPDDHASEAYLDGPLPIGRGQTISQPYVVASMTEQLQISSSSRVLEIGTGSGYQCAVLAEIAREVYTIEVVEELHVRARGVLERLYYGNVRFRLGDGNQGWPEAAPFDGIIVTAAAAYIPPALTDQLTDGGRLVIPVATGKYGGQDLILMEKTPEGLQPTTLYPVRFVPLQPPGTDSQ